MVVALVFHQKHLTEVENWLKEMYDIGIVDAYCGYYVWDTPVHLTKYEVTNDTGVREFNYYQISFENKDDAALFKLTFEVV